MSRFDGPLPSDPDGLSREAREHAEQPDLRQAWAAEARAIRRRRTKDKAVEVSAHVLAFLSELLNNWP